ncbi:MAG: Hsp20/alpha crystallin family protein [Bacteroidetes bacterium]|nr:MAG: Hsp20/alpha crystallin family protein [Bacteroidota bacterium]MBL1145360.1 Hsp20/alpha crystallin family protein [Bacteroidota bacterium]MCB0801891.1 Hsp20/alpha crystallin family protein [Flavobacteriales bacterium]NOG58158.1 Hsp20/alpha crystallin family protein [Bacteroidota bacterium]
MTTLIRKNEDVFPRWNSFFDNDWLNLSGLAQTNDNIPAVNIKDTADCYKIEMAAPGMKKEDFSVNLDNGVLTISSEKKSENSEKDNDGNYTRREFSYRSFRRAFHLPDSAESENITASYKDGVLQIAIPKKEEAKPKPIKMIEIK